ncbi:MAG: DUF2927 domain-containing protein [Rhodobacteraceae bacterium]|nr:DUF2927 domain-containing protein [Paracoccaceae bacterium]
MPENRRPALIRQFRQFATALGLLAGLAACVEMPDQVVSTPAEQGPARSAESLRLEAYYASIQNRLLAQGLLRTDGGGTDVPFSEETLVQDFERIALYDEYTIRNNRFVAQQTPSHLRRWQQPIRIGLLFGDLVDMETRAKDRANVAAYAQRLSRLTGVPITLTNTNANFHILFLHRDEQKTVGPELRKRVPRLSPVVIDEIVNSPRSTFCVAYAFSDAENSNAYSAAIILVKAEHGDLMRLSCIHEEMAQAMGLANDSPAARPSIFNDDEEFALLTRHDEMLLRMLYDRRLKLGMTPETARPLLPAIAADVMRGNS